MFANKYPGFAPIVISRYTLGRNGGTRIVAVQTEDEQNDATPCPCMTTNVSSGTPEAGTGNNRRSTKDKSEGLFRDLEIRRSLGGRFITVKIQA